MREDGLRARFRLCKLFLFNGYPLKVLNCQKCNKPFFTTIKTDKNDESEYIAYYQCNHCGALVKEHQIWVDKFNLNYEDE